MVNYFVKNKHGVVSVFCAVILIATLSFSSLFLEIGKKKSVDAAFKQASENAAFSMLGNYDRELYKRFGLLALSPNVDAKTFETYLENNMNSGLKSSVSDVKGLDNQVKVTDAEIEPMYDLADTDVLRNQIEEVTKYRAPVNAINETFELEANLKKFFTEKLKAFPIISFAFNLSNVATQILDVISDIGKSKEAGTQYKNDDNAYESGVKTYNTARKTYESDMKSLDSSDEKYEEKKQQIEDAKSSAINTMNTQITNLQTSVNSLKNRSIKLSDDLEKITLTSITAVLQGMILKEKNKISGKTDGYELFTEYQAKKYNQYLDGIDNLNKATNTDNFLISCKGAIDDLKGLPYDNFINRLENQKTKVNNFEEISVEDFGRGLVGTFIVALTIVQALLDIIQQLNVICDAVKALVDAIQFIAKACDIISTVFFHANLTMNDSIEGVTATLPSYQKGPGFMDKRRDYMDTVDADRDKVDLRLDDTKDVANALGYSLDTMSPRTDYTQAEYEEAGHKVCEAKENLMAIKSNLWTVHLPIIGAIALIVIIAECVIAVASLCSAIIDYLKEFKKWFSFEKLWNSIVSNMMVSSYAVNMFPNRTTDTFTTSNLDLLRNKYCDYGYYWSSTSAGFEYVVNKDNFSTARAEYIYAGQESEIDNQQVVFQQIEKYRIFNNVLVMFFDDMCRDFNSKCIEGGPIGWIIAIVVDIIFLCVETNIDMVLLCCLGAKFEVIKTKSWLTSYNRVQELAELLESSFKNETSKQLITSKFKAKASDNKLVPVNEKTVPDDNKTPKFLQWGYEDYLGFMITFKNNDYVVTRIADLIQLEMNANYKHNKNETYDINKAYTYMKFKTKGEYKPLLPMISIPLAKDKMFNVEIEYYTGY